MAAASSPTNGVGALSANVREAMEQLNAQAAGLHIWLRTQANAPAQQPWARDTGLEAGGRVAAGRVAAGQLKALPHHWRWREISPYLTRIAELARSGGVSPIEFADRQQFLLTNPGLGGRLQVANAIRCAVSIYNPGDVAPVHRHTPNASRTILSDNGGYTTVDGERCEATRGDVIITPNGSWHDHGNDGATPVIWMDILDWPLLEFLDCIWLDDDFPGARQGRTRAQAVSVAAGTTGRRYGRGGLVPARRDERAPIAPLIHYRGSEIRAALADMREETGDPYEGIKLDLVNPRDGAPLFPTLSYSAQLLRVGETTHFKRETASTLYTVIEGSGVTEVAGQRFEWEVNDIFVVPNFLWRRHQNTGAGDAVLYAVSDRPLLEKIGQFRAQGREAAQRPILELA
ncbi:MAG TPA: cupin domain-containing protein [Candidatus Binataceae bacterium]|nr:cupin domain-containing protein [Candidatus Binataceae bacterium]